MGRQATTKDIDELEGDGQTQETVQSAALEYATLNAEIKQLEATVKLLKQRKDDLEDRLKDVFADAGIESIRVRGFDKDAIIDSLTTEELIAFNILWNNVITSRELGVGDPPILVALDAIKRVLLGNESARSTLYLSRELWALAKRGENGEPLTAVTVEALKRYPETAAFVTETFNARTLSSWAKELPQRDDDDLPILPKELEGFIHLDERISVKVRRQ